MTGYFGPYSGAFNTSPGIDAFFKFGGFIKFFPIVIFSQLMHTGARRVVGTPELRVSNDLRRAGIPVLVQPMKNKDGARKVFGYAYMITGSFYCLGVPLAPPHRAVRVWSRLR